MQHPKADHGEADSSHSSQPLYSDPCRSLEAFGSLSENGVKGLHWDQSVGLSQFLLVSLWKFLQSYVSYKQGKTTTNGLC